MLIQENVDTAMETVTISRKEYSDLLEDSKFLAALQNVGVDNWDGYIHAVELLNEDD